MYVNIWCQKRLISGLGNNCISSDIAAHVHGLIRWDIIIGISQPWQERGTIRDWNRTIFSYKFGVRNQRSPKEQVHSQLHKRVSLRVDLSGAHRTGVLLHINIKWTSMACGMGMAGVSQDMVGMSLHRHRVNESFLGSRESPEIRADFLGRGWGQQLFSFQSPAVQWMARTSSLNCLSCRNPYQTLDSLNCLPPFHWKTLFFTEKCFVASPSQTPALMRDSFRDSWTFLEPALAELARR